MSRAADRSAPPAFSPQEWMGLYLAGRHAELSEGFLNVLRHFRETTYHTLDPQGTRFVNEFVRLFLTLFTQDDYTPSREHAFEFVRLNATTANLVALSCFGTTDRFLALLLDRPANLAKILALNSARNHVACRGLSFFDLDPALASAWYGAYTESFRAGIIRADVIENLRAHFFAADDRIDAQFTLLDAYFASTYVGGGCDRVVKRVLNRAVRRAAGAEGVRLPVRPDPRKVAVLSGNWSTNHSAYRITAAFVKALKDAGYHLTFFPLGRRQDVDLGGFDDVRPLAFGRDGATDLGTFFGGGFMVAYYPDVGLTAHSILLANLRVAPIQIASLGHSVSTFGAEIDYFVSGAGVEPADDPARNYSERLVLLPGLGAVHNRPRYTPSGRRKATPDLLVNCPWNAQKVNHEFALALGELVRRSRRTIRLRLFVSGSISRQNDYLPFVRDLHTVLGRESVEVFRELTYPDYMALMEEGDFSLDSYPFGGCNTVADSLYLRKLTLTREGDAWYNRIGPAMLRMVGLPELAVTTRDDFIETALRLVHDDAYRASLQDRLDRADLDATVFATGEAISFRMAVDYLIANHDRLQGDPDRSPIRIASGA